MRTFILIGCLLAGLTGCSASADRPAGPETERVIALGGAVAETVVALGAADRLVGRDASATFPDAVTAVPSVGYYRQLSAEGVLSLAPTLVLVDPSAGPEAVVRQIDASGVRLVRLPGGGTPEATEAQIRAIAAALDRDEAADSLVAQLRDRLDAAARLAPEVPPRVLFVLGMGGGPLQMAGRETLADAFIHLAGAANAFEAVEGYRPMSPEALVEIAPDVVLMLDGTAGSAGGAQAFATRPEVRATPAGRDGRVIVLPDHALHFGPSLGEAVLDFADRLARLPS